MNWLSKVGYDFRNTSRSRSNFKDFQYQLQHAHIVAVPIAKPKKLLQETIKQPNPLAKVRPYKKEDLFLGIEAEMEKMMKNIKRKIKQKGQD